jgi:hypothetical protein
MCISAIVIEKIATEGSLMVPTAVTDNIGLIGPLGQVTRGALSARRITKSDNPIVWAV